MLGQSGNADDGRHLSLCQVFVKWQRCTPVGQGRSQCPFLHWQEVTTSSRSFSTDTY